MQNDFLRIGTGVPGLDTAIEGGFPFPSTILVAGEAGSGKTTFGLQFLFEGARNGEQGLFITTLSEPTQWMMRFASRWEFVDKDLLGTKVKYVDMGRILQNGIDGNGILNFIEENIIETTPQRIVIDPITVLQHMLGDKYRRFMYDLASRLKNWQAVTIFTGEARPAEPYPFDVAYATDGVILMTNEDAGKEGRKKYLEVLKMRGTDHRSGKNSMDLTLGGVSIQPGLR